MYDASFKWNLQELYEKAWQIPQRLSVEYDVSDVPLGKVY
jgi:hypothetical protein